MWFSDTTFSKSNKLHSQCMNVESTSSRCSSFNGCQKKSSNCIEENGNPQLLCENTNYIRVSTLCLHRWTGLSSFNTQQRSMPLDPPKLHSGSNLLTKPWKPQLVVDWWLVQRWKWMVDSAGLRQTLYCSFVWIVMWCQIVDLWILKTFYTSRETTTNRL